ncbi:hypothetical protein V5O49_00255, partial [Isoptericola sp. MSP01]
GTTAPAALGRDCGPVPEVGRVDTVTGEADARVQIVAGSMSDVERSVESCRVTARVAKPRTAIVMSRVTDRPARRDGAVPRRVERLCASGITS